MGKAACESDASYISLMKLQIASMIVSVISIGVEVDDTSSAELCVSVYSSSE